jgi:hypothetical protein
MLDGNKSNDDEMEIRKMVARLSNAESHIFALGDYAKKMETLIAKWQEKNRNQL